MPSRKRAKGRARKAKARESNCNLILHNDNVCRHGCEVLSKDDVCYKFVKQFEVELNVVYESIKQISLSECFSATVDKLKASKEYDTIWDGSEEIQQKLQSLFINLGTNLLLKNQIDSTKLTGIVATFAITSFNNFSLVEAMAVSKSRNLLRDLTCGCLYDYIKFFYKRSSCQCLKKMYSRVRSKPRLARCAYCKERKDRRGQLYLCSGCLHLYYCNVECQEKHWPKHKPVCNNCSGVGKVQ